MHHVPVLISSPVWVLNCLHGQVSDQNGGRIHRTNDLINYILDCVPITDTAALVDVTSEEDYLGYHFWQIGIPRLAVLIDAIQLLLCQFSDCYGLDLPPS